MLLSDLVEDFDIQVDKFNYKDLEIAGIELNSKNIKENYIFFALRGANLNGADYIPNAIENGCKVIVCSNEEEGIEDKYKDIVILKHSNPRWLLGEFLRVFYKEKPSNIFGITGTKGKTSVTEYVRQTLQNLGYNTASLGTLGIKTKDNSYRKDTLTMTDTVTLHKELNGLKLNNNIDYVIMEMTSQGMFQERSAGVNIKVGAFTNFSRDHLECHGNMEEYFRCKMILFRNILKNGSPVVLNADIKEYNEIRKICEEKEHKILTYGENGDIKLMNVIPNRNGQKIVFKYKEKQYELNTNLIGNFQAPNLLCAFGIVVSSGIDKTPAEIVEVLQNVKPAEGRADLAGITKTGASVYVDYAHTPDSLEKILITMKDHIKATKPGRIILVFGAGGDRDPSKRPIMGKVAKDYADVIYVTEDNPRNEDPAQVRKGIMEGCPNAIEIIDGREHAIREAIKNSKDGDIIILAGKGHEKYIMGKNLEKTYFNEFEIVKDAIENQ